jgi:hypothetical protein
MSRNQTEPDVLPEVVVSNVDGSSPGTHFWHPGQFHCTPDVFEELAVDRGLKHLDIEGRCPELLHEPQWRKLRQDDNWA